MPQTGKAKQVFAALFEKLAGHQDSARNEVTGATEGAV